MFFEFTQQQKSEIQKGTSEGFFSKKKIECPRFEPQRKKFLRGLGEDARALIHTGNPEANLRYILTSRDPSVWRRFAWMLARIYAKRHQGWVQYIQRIVRQRRKLGKGSETRRPESPFLARRAVAG